MAGCVVVPVPLILKETVEVVSLNLRVQISVAEQRVAPFVAGPMPQTLEEIVAMASLVLQKRVQRRTPRAHCGCAGFWSAEVVRSAPRAAEQLIRGRAELVVAVPVSQSLEEVVEVVRWVPQERVQQWTEKPPVEVPVPQVWEEIAKVVRFVPQRVQWIVEQFVSTGSPRKGDVAWAGGPSASLGKKIVSVSRIMKEDIQQGTRGKTMVLVAEMQEEQVRAQTSERICVSVGVPIPEVAEQLVTRWVAVPVPQHFEYHR